jgi:hypothetical protein
LWQREGGHASKGEGGGERVGVRRHLRLLGGSRGLRGTQPWHYEISSMSSRRMRSLGDLVMPWLTFSEAWPPPAASAESCFGRVMRREWSEEHVGGVHKHSMLGKANLQASMRARMRADEIVGAAAASTPCPICRTPLSSKDLFDSISEEEQARLDAEGKMGAISNDEYGGCWREGRGEGLVVVVVCSWVRC